MYMNMCICTTSLKESWYKACKVYSDSMSVCNVHVDVCTLDLGIYMYMYYVDL